MDEHYERLAGWEGAQLGHWVAQAHEVEGAKPRSPQGRHQRVEAYKRQVYKRLFAHRAGEAAPEKQGFPAGGWAARRPNCWAPPSARQCRLSGLGLPV